MKQIKRFEIFTELKENYPKLVFSKAIFIFQISNKIIYINNLTYKNNFKKERRKFWIKLICRHEPKDIKKEVYGYSWKCIFQRDCSKCQKAIKEDIETYNEIQRQKRENLNNELKAVATYIGMGGSKEDIEKSKEILGNLND